MAKYFIDVVHDSPRTRLGIPVKTKNPLVRTNTPPAEPPFSFDLHGRLVPAYSRVRLFRHPFARSLPPSPIRSLIRLNRPAATAGRGKRSPPNRRGSPVRPGLATRCVDPDAILTSPRRCYSLVFITSVTNDSMSVQIRSDWSIRGTIVSGVSSASTA